MDALHIGWLTAAVAAPRARPAQLFAFAQAGKQIATQLATWHGVQCRLNGFMRSAFGWIIGIHEMRCAANLIWRPPLISGSTIQLRIQQQFDSHWRWRIRRRQNRGRFGTE